MAVLQCVASGDMENKMEEPEKICYNCERSVRIGETDVCVCDRRGVVHASGSCRAYRLDLLKLTPRLRRPERAEYEIFRI